MVRDTFVSYRACTHDNITWRQVGLQRTGGADREELSHSDRDEVFENRGRDRSTNPESADHPDTTCSAVERYDTGVDRLTADRRR